MKVLCLRALALVTLMLGGCAGLTTIHKKDEFTASAANSTQIISVDAKQRLIYSNMPASSGDNYRRFCAEPPPDALTAMSVGLSGDLGVATADPEARLRAALALGETASTIERTQTVNILREAMFRTCERYMSGAINADDFIIQAARDQRMIISVLAIEQLTRASRPPATVISAGGASATYSDPLALQGALKRSQDELLYAQKEVTAAEKVYSALTVGPEPCTPELKLPDQTDTQSADDYSKLKDQFAACQSKTDSFTAAKSRQKNAEDAVALYKSIVQQQAFGLTSTAGAGASFNARAESIDRPSGADLAKVADVVKEIALKSYDSDEIYMTCVVRLRKIANGVDYAKFPTLEILDRRCIDLLKQRAEMELAKGNQDISAAVDARVSEREQQLAVVSSYLDKTTAKETVQTLWDALKNAPGIDKALWVSESTKDGAIGRFKGMNSDLREYIVTYIKGLP